MDISISAHVLLCKMRCMFFFIVQTFICSLRKNYVYVLLPFCCQPFSVEALQFWMSSLISLAVALFWLKAYPYNPANPLILHAVPDQTAFDFLFPRKGLLSCRYVYKPGLGHPFLTIRQRNGTSYTSMAADGAGENYDGQGTNPSWWAMCKCGLEPLQFN